MESLFQSLRPKAERHIVYPLNRDECVALLDAGERLERRVAELERDLEHAYTYYRETQEGGCV